VLHISEATPRVNNVIRADLTGADTCSTTWVQIRDTQPVLALCRSLLAAGLDPDQALEVYRGTTLALRVRSIREGARLEINSHGTDFVGRRARRAASPMRSRELAATPAWAEAAE
jgi:hypothetical protein